MLRPHFPSPIAAVGIVIGAWFASTLLWVSVSDPEKIDIGAIGIATTIAFGAIGTLAARRVPEPKALRLGLVGFDIRLAPALALLLPWVVVASELDNWIAAALPPPDPEVLKQAIEESLAKDTALSIAQRSLFLVGLLPVVAEWLLRGVVLQGVVAHLGRAGGVIFTSVLGVGTVYAAGTTFASLAVCTLLAGALLGIARLATGSLLAPIVLHMGWNAIVVAATTFRDELPISGFNTLDGSHTPLALVAPAVAACALALSILSRALRTQPVAIPIEPDKDDDGEGGFF